MSTDNAYDPYAADFDFGGAADTGCVVDDSADYEMQCRLCHEPCHRKAMSKHDKTVCRVCCPVLAAEAAADAAWEAVAALGETTRDIREEADAADWFYDNGPDRLAEDERADVLGRRIVRVAGGI